MENERIGRAERHSRTWYARTRDCARTWRTLNNLLLMLYSCISWLCTANLIHKGAIQVRAIELRIQLAPLFTFATQTDPANQRTKLMWKGKSVQKMVHIYLPFCVYFYINKRLKVLDHKEQTLSYRKRGCLMSQLTFNLNLALHSIR